MKDSNISFFQRAGLLFCLFVSILFYLGLPLKEDQRSSLACAQQGDYLDSFPGCITKSYHLRGIGHKALNYLIYKPIAALVGTDNKALFEPLFKTGTCLLYFSLLLGSIAACKDTIRTAGLDPLIVLGLCLAAFVTTSPDLHFQAEEISILLVILGLSMSLSGSLTLQYLAGLPLALTFSMKGVTLALGVLAIIARYAIYPDDRRGLLRLVISFSGFSIVVIVATFAFIPQDLRDLRDTALIEGSQFTIPDRIKNVWTAIRGTFDELPMVISGLIATIPVILYYLTERRFRMLIGFALLWVAPVVPALVQGKGYSYHLAGFLIPALFAILALNVIVLSRGLALPWKIGATCIPVLICFLFTGPLPLFGGYNYWQIVRIARYQNALFSRWNKTFDLPNQPDILYLTAGDAAYYVQAKSYLRYFVPVSIQRIARNPRLREMARFQEDVGTAKCYHGKFIILDEIWFHEPFLKVPELRQKIDAEYRCIDYSNPWSIYERK